jgi:hypothetical protein
MFVVALDSWTFSHLVKTITDVSSTTTDDYDTVLSLLKKQVGKCAELKANLPLRVERHN